MYDLPRAGRPTMMMTSLDPTSRSGIRPSGETLDLVMPGILSVVACVRTLGVWLPEFWRKGGLRRQGCRQRLTFPIARQRHRFPKTYMRGELGAVEASDRGYGLSDREMLWSVVLASACFIA